MAALATFFVAVSKLATGTQEQYRWRAMACCKQKAPTSVAAFSLRTPRVDLGIFDDVAELPTITVQRPRQNKKRQPLFDDGALGVQVPPTPFHTSQNLNPKPTFTSANTSGTPLLGSSTLQ